MEKIRAAKLVAPDAGWGWVVTFGVSIINLATRSIEPSFGLLFGDLLRDLEVGTTGAALIISCLDVMMNFSGLFVGPLLKEFSYRKVAIAGACLCALGLALTSPAKSMAHILCTYSVINGLGVGLATSAAFVALNHYFKKKRGQAVGLSMAGTAGGMLVMPQLVRILLESFGFQGAVLLLSGLALHSAVGATLLQPVKWHLVEEEVDVEMVPIQEMNTIKEDDEDDLPELKTLLYDNKRFPTANSAPVGANGVQERSETDAPIVVVTPPINVPSIPAHNTNGQGHHSHMPPTNPISLFLSRHSGGGGAGGGMKKNYSELAMGSPKMPMMMGSGTIMGTSESQGQGMGARKPTFPRIMSSAEMSMNVRRRKESVISTLSQLDFSGSYMQIHLNTGDDDNEDIDYEVIRRVKSHAGSNMSSMGSFARPHKNGSMNTIRSELGLQMIKPKKTKASFWKKFASFMDVEMLKDRRYLNILFGLSIFYVAEMSFKMITPFFLANLGYAKGDIAFCLSITAITDILARIVLPPIMDKFSVRKRIIFMVSIVFLAICRSVIAELTSWTPLMTWLCIAGFFRGVALSNFTLCVSEYCTLEQLPGAFGWHMIGKAVFVICFGPLIGAIRDYTSYSLCIHAMNVCIFVGVLAWVGEFILDRFRKAEAAKE